MGDNTLPDQVAAMKELAARYPWIDLDRAGIWGHSGGGYATAGAMQAGESRGAVWAKLQTIKPTTIATDHNGPLCMNTPVRNRSKLIADD